jgi:hypothetical protein
MSCERLVDGSCEVGRPIAMHRPIDRDPSTNASRDVDQPIECPILCLA